MTEPNEPAPEVDDLAADDDEVLHMRAVRKLRNENKRLRHLLRETEENRATDLARIAAFEKREVEREAAAVLVDPEDIWRTDERRNRPLSTSSSAKSSATRNRWACRTDVKRFIARSRCRVS
jgi:hypothetical protein